MKEANELKYIYIYPLYMWVCTLFLSVMHTHACRRAHNAYTYTLIHKHTDNIISIYKYTEIIYIIINNDAGNTCFKQI